MNRAFFLIFAPPLLVALLYLNFGWGLQVSLWSGAGVLAAAGLIFLWRRGSSRPSSGGQRSEDQKPGA